ncbi:hypothetical protein JCM33374_g3880 [Metschnikowia sp. JCM 33374]|nr:hypothetical protein JCM33374_g3880 [Metschnikowia sp. JCM 33374]
MFTQKLRSPYMESSAATSNGFFRPEYIQYNHQWEGPGASGYENHAVYENESDSALSRIYTLGEEKPMLLSPLIPEHLTRMETFTPEFKPEPKLDDLELQVLSSAPSELSSWSESEENPNLVKYESESSLEHLHNIQFSPEQLSGVSSRLNFVQANDTGFIQDGFHTLGHGRHDPYHGWKYCDHEQDTSNHIDLTEMVDGVFSGNSVATRPIVEPKNPDIRHEYTKDKGSNMPVGLRNAMNANHRVFRPSLDATAANRLAQKSLARPMKKSGEGQETPPAENFILRPWPVNDGMIRTPINSGQETNHTLRVPIPCLSAVERWRKHTEKYKLDPKLSGDMICTHCDQTFDDVERYVAHLDAEKVVHDNFCPDSSCAFSALGFRYRWLLRRHICNHHLKDYNNKKLRKSSTSPGGKNALTENFLSHVYVCKKKNCSRAFYRSDSLSRHEKLIHSVGSKQKRKERLKLGKCDPKIFE